MQGSGPGGKVTKADVLAAADGKDGASAATGCGGRGQAPAGSGGDARRGDEPEPRDPDRDLVQDGAGRHPRRQAEGAQRGPLGSGDEDLLHAPHRLGDREGGGGVAGDGPVVRRSRRQAVRDRPGGGEPRDRRRRRAQGRAQPDGAVHQGRRRARLRGVPQLLRGPDHQDAGEQAHSRRLQGHDDQPHEPGWPRDRRLGAAPDERPGDDHRLRLARLSGRVGARRPRADQGARHLKGHDDDLHLRPPRDPGRRVGIVPAPDRSAPAG